MKRCYFHPQSRTSQFVQNNIYYMKHKEKSDFIILHFYDYINIINSIDTNPKEILNNIIIFNVYGDVVLNMGNLDNTISKEMQIIFFLNKLSMIEIFHYSQKVKIKYELYAFLSKRLKFDNKRIFYLFFSLALYPKDFSPLITVILIVSSTRYLTFPLSSSLT